MVLMIHCGPREVRTLRKWLPDLVALATMQRLGIAPRASDAPCSGGGRVSRTGVGLHRYGTAALTNIVERGKGGRPGCELSSHQLSRHLTLVDGAGAVVFFWGGKGAWRH